MSMDLDRFCSIFLAVNIFSIKSKLPQDVSFHKICDLCERDENNLVEVKFFQLPAEVRKILPELFSVEKSSIFQEVWRQFGKKAQADRQNDETQKVHLTLSDVVNKVWKQAFQTWNKLVEHVMDGSATLKEIDKHFESFKGRTEELKEELHAVFSLIQEKCAPQGRATKSKLATTVKQRVTQIQRYQQLHQYASAADTIWDFKEAMAFSGDFKVIEDLRNQVDTFFFFYYLNCGFRNEREERYYYRNS